MVEPTLPKNMIVKLDHSTGIGVTIQNMWNHHLDDNNNNNNKYARLEKTISTWYLCHQFVKHWASSLIENSCEGIAEIIHQVLPLVLPSLKLTMQKPPEN